MNSSFQTSRTNVYINDYVSTFVPEAVAALYCRNLVNYWN